MEFVCSKSKLQGNISIPGSKSHTIRGLLIGALAPSQTVLQQPLSSGDTEAAVRAVEALGASVEQHDDRWLVNGCDHVLKPAASYIDLGNSGTTLRLVLGLGSLITEGEVLVTGDEQLQRRSCAPLIDALQRLGADIASEGGDGYAPFRTRGGLKGGCVSLEAITSQYLSSLLMACPIAPEDTDIEVPRLNESPYVQMTLDWLRSQDIRLEQNDMSRFYIPGGQRYSPASCRIPADFSSASFFLAAGALPGNEITCEGLDINDSQPDKRIIDYLNAMGADTKIETERVHVRSNKLVGTDIDMNDTPDAVPIMSVVASFAEGPTKLYNVSHARLKETDRIRVMATELPKLGTEIEEREDGLIIKPGRMHGAFVNGHGDHRVTMALAIGGLFMNGTTRVNTAESADITLPSFLSLLQQIGGSIVRE